MSTMDECPTMEPSILEDPTTSKKRKLDCLKSDGDISIVNKPGIGDLPDELLLKIFSNLGKS